jgi:hypothetical protein
MLSRPLSSMLTLPVMASSPGEVPRASSPPCRATSAISMPWPVTWPTALTSMRRACTAPPSSICSVPVPSSSATLIRSALQAELLPVTPQSPPRSCRQ